MVNKVVGNGVGGKINGFIDKVFWFYLSYFLKNLLSNKSILLFLWYK